MSKFVREMDEGCVRKKLYYRNMTPGHLGKSTVKTNIETWDTSPPPPPTPRQGYLPPSFLYLANYIIDI